MALISTEQLMKEYFAQTKESVQKNMKGSIERPELYQYEIEIGKQLIDMNSEELIGLLLRYYSRNTSKHFTLKQTTYTSIATYMRNIFDYYIVHYEPIVNPWRTKEMKTKVIMERLSAEATKVTWQQFEDVFNKMYVDYTKEDAEYMECIIRLYYEGFKSSDDLLNIKESMINFRTKEIKYNGNSIKLSDRTFSLLVKNHNTSEIKGGKNVTLEAIAWERGYFNIFVTPRIKDKFLNGDLGRSDARNKINLKIARNVREKYNIDASANTLFYLGAFDELVVRYGEEKVREMVYSVNDSGCNQVLFAYAAERGVNVNNILYFKRQLMSFI